MIVTEEEAKTKRCCGPSGTGRLDPTAGVITFVHRERLCIGSACMAWDWIVVWPSGASERRRVKPAQDDTSIASGGSVFGYCGYAGG